MIILGFVESMILLQCIVNWVVFMNDTIKIGTIPFKIDAN